MDGAQESRTIHYIDNMEKMGFFQDILDNIPVKGIKSDRMVTMVGFSDDVVDKLIKYYDENYE